MPRKTTSSAPQHTTRGEQTRLRITQAAAALVHRHGFHHTSLDDILAAAKVPKGSLYFYFRNKEELGFAIIRYRRDFLLDALSGHLRAARTAAAAYQAVVCFYAEYPENRRRVFGLPGR